MLNAAQINKPYRAGVNAIILDQENRILLVQKNGWKDNEWTIPGGGKDGSETPEENLFRELEEEIGAHRNDLIIIGLSSQKIKYDYPIDLAKKVNGGKYIGQSYGQFVLRFMGDKDKLEFTTKEFKDHKWVSASELIKYLILPNQYQNHKNAIDEILPNLIE